MPNRTLHYQSSLKKAQRCLAAGELIKAQELYEQLCKSGKKGRDVCLTLVIIYRKLKKFREAELLCEVE